MAREKIKKLIEKSVKELQKEKFFAYFKIPKILIERKKEKIFGDYSTNITLEIGKILKLDPLEIAEKMKSKLESRNSKIFKKIEIKKPGFINFFLSKEYLQKQAEEILKEGESFGKLDIGKNKKAQVEFISANPTGPLHIGNGRGAFFGDCLANVLEKTGYKVEREYYVNNPPVSAQIRLLGQTALGKGTTYLTDDLKLKIEKLKSQLEKISDEGEVGYLLAHEVQKDIKAFIEKKLKIKFDRFFYEEEDLYQKNKIKKIYDWLKSKNLIYKREGAEWIKISEFGAPKDEVIVRQDGCPSYFLGDIAYHKDKFDRKFQKIINIWGADHQGHVPKMKAVAKILGYKRDLDLLITQLVTLKGKPKISKRKGEIVTLEELIDDIGLDSARFFYLQKSIDTHMEIDLELAKEQSEKNPVYYIQYAHTRICGILRKAKIKSEKLKISIKNLKLLNHPSELELIKQLIRFPEIIKDTAKDYQVQRIPQYALDLATIFHQFYRDCRVILGDKNFTQARLALILATKQLIENTLALMGISAPERM